jgi:cytochrome c-type biogenesis protein CcmH
MTLWVLVALMTLAAMLAVGWPLMRRPSPAVADAAGDVAVYRDQIAEIERDRAAGVIGTSEAEAARAEVSRRLIAAADAARARDERRGETSRGWPSAVAGALVSIPVCAIGLYLAVGSPNLPGEPLQARIARAQSSDQTLESLLTKVEAHLGQHPDDGRGWEVIAPVYMRLGRYDDAVRARTNALRLLGASADRHADLGEALVAAGNGVVTADAKAAFDAAIRLDAANVTARFYEGLAAQQDGNRAEAARLWHALLQSAPRGAQWASFVRQALARLDSPQLAGSPTPDAATADSQGQMIRGMVDRLAARLHRDGSDVEGWIRLVRSYKVLGESEKMAIAVADAMTALANEPDKLERLKQGLKSLEMQSPPAASTPEGEADAAPAADAAIGVDPMVRGMVDRLDARLRKDGSDVEGWIELVRSYKELGELDLMRAAIANARRALANDAQKLRRLDNGIKNLGLGS